MSVTWYLVCLDTGESLSIGSLSSQRTAMGEVYAFDKLNYYSAVNCAAEQQDIKMRSVIHFLVRHRGRNLTVVPDYVHGKGETGSKDLFPVNNMATWIPDSPEDYQQLFDKPVGNPYASNDENLYPEKLFKRLEELSRGENIERLPWDLPANDNAKG